MIWALGDWAHPQASQVISALWEKNYDTALIMIF